MDLTLAAALFLVSAIVIAIGGTILARVADQLADLTGWGEAMFAAVFVGGATSLPGSIASIVAAYQGYPVLAVSNAIGGIAAQTVFLSVADISYPKINLEHAAASFANLMQGVLLMGLLSIILIGISGPEVTVFHIHPFSIVIILLYVLGTKLIYSAKNRPMWNPRITHETVEDKPDQQTIENLSLKKVGFKFFVLVVVVSLAGYAVAESGIAISENTGLSESLVGALFTAVATSLPELVVSVAAVRQRALILAVGNIIGGNTFDVLFIAFADLAFLQGSILHALTSDQIFITALALLMTAVLILGLLHREKQGIAKIGWESVTVVIIYLGAYLFLFFG